MSDSQQELPGDDPRRETPPATEPYWSSDQSGPIPEPPPDNPSAERAHGAGSAGGGPEVWPPLVPRIIAASGAGLVLLTRLVDITGDHSANNILALIGLATAVLTLLIWGLLNPAFPKLWRRGVLAALVLLLLVAVAVVRIDHVTGDMMPRFRFVWSLPRDARLSLELAPATEEGVPLGETSSEDFPQFLGPERNGTVSSVELQGDWDAEPPEMVWKQPIGAGWSGFAAVNGFAVTLEQRGDDELVTCYEADSGRMQWFHAIQGRHESTLGGIGPRSTPTIHEGRVYALGATGVLRCLDGSDGSLLWTRDLLAEFGVTPGRDSAAIEWGRAGSPLVVDSLVVVPAGGPSRSPVSLVAYERLTGEEIWRAGSTQISYSSPIVGELDGVRQIIIVNENTVSGHVVESGRTLWSFAWPGNSTGDANTSQPHVIRDADGDSVLVSKGYVQGAARHRVWFDRQQDAWQVEKVFESSRVLKTKMTSAVIKGDYAFGLSDGILECIEVRGGTSQWKGGRYGHGQILLVGDHLLVLSESGDLVLVEATASGHSELHRLPVFDGKTWNTICLHGSLLLVRNGEEAACYRLALARRSL
jgi:outer membrane protein assembly factor BamB